MSMKVCLTSKNEATLRIWFLIYQMLAQLKEYIKVFRTHLEMKNYMSFI